MSDTQQLSLFTSQTTAKSAQQAPTTPAKKPYKPVSTKLSDYVDPAACHGEAMLILRSQMSKLIRAGTWTPESKRLFLALLMTEASIKKGHVPEVTAVHQALIHLNKSLLR